MVYIGVDPGVSGGIAALDEDGDVILAARMPETDRDLYDLLSQIPMNRLIVDFDRRAVLERVWSSPGWGHVGAFKFGMSYGGLRMALTAARIPFEEVLPRTWQKELGCASGKDKNITKRRAQALFPQANVTHATADALLLAEYCRRQQRIYGQESREEQRAEAETGIHAQGRPAEESGRQRAIRQRVERTRQRLGEAEAHGPAVPGAPRHGAGARSNSRSRARADR